MIRRALLLIPLFYLYLSGYSQSPEMILVEGGSFIMGNDYTDFPDERPEHKVELKSFYIGKFEVTFDEFLPFCETTGIPKPEDGGYGKGKLPVTNVSWNSAIMFCNWLSAREKLTKCYEIKRDSDKVTVTLVPDADGYRLPTEAEWEYAAKGGSKTKGLSYSGSNQPEDIGWFKLNSGGKPHEVGQKTPNELGIYDMTGNVWEWCWDTYNAKYYKDSPAANPTGPDKGYDKVYRGGSWNSPAEFIRLSRRYSMAPGRNQGLIGIRLTKTKK